MALAKYLEDNCEMVSERLWLRQQPEVLGHATAPRQGAADRLGGANQDERR